MAVYNSNLVIYTGTDFQQSFILANESDDTSLVLSGYTVTSKLKSHPKASTSTSFTTAITDANSGKLRISLNSTQTSSLKPGRYYYDVVIIDTNSKKTRVVEGEVFVKKSVTR